MLRLLTAGRTVSEIAAELSLSIKTVSTYRSRLAEKLGVRTNGDLVRYALEHKLFDWAAVAPPRPATAVGQGLPHKAPQSGFARDEPFLYSMDAGTR